MLYTPEIKSFSVEQSFPQGGKQLLREVSRSKIPFIQGALRIAQNEQGSSNASFLIWGFSILSSIFILTQSCQDRTQNQQIAALKATVTALSTPQAEQPEQKILAVKEPLDEKREVAWHQQDITIILSENFKPSKITGEWFNESRNPDNLISWENIETINGTPIKGAKSLLIEKPLVTWSPAKKDTGLNIFAQNYDVIDLIELTAVVCNRSGQLEQRPLYLPAGISDSLDYIPDYQKVRETPTDIQIDQREDGKLFPIKYEFLKRQPELPQNQVGRVTVLN